MRAQLSPGQSGHARAQDHRPLKIERNREYDPFAPIYNRYWGAEYRASAFPIVERLLLSRLNASAAVLDVCCGTGQFSELIRRRGYRLEGIDASERMIEFARRNAPDIPFTVADARDFSLGRTFDAAYSVFESLNHIPDIEGLALAFGRVRRHLAAGAPFLFDLNREEAFSLFWNNTDAIVEDDNVCVMISNYDADARVGSCNITAFELSGNCARNGLAERGDQGKVPESLAPRSAACALHGHWNRTDFIVRQTCHDTGAACDALSRCGFRDVTLYDARDAGMMGDPGYARTFFLAFA